MKANDLRIGNLIYVPSGDEKYVFGTRYKTILYTSHLDNYTYSEAYDYECEPISLTEDWLLKFGFIKRYEDCFEHKKFILNNEFVMMDIDITIKLKYVHQLQNLYFALTGEELELKK